MKEALMARFQEDVCVCVYLQGSSSEEDAGTGDGLGLESHKHISPQGVVHVVPMEAETTHRNKHIASSPQSHRSPTCFNRAPQ